MSFEALYLARINQTPEDSKFTNGLYSLGAHICLGEYAFAEELVTRAESYMGSIVGEDYIGLDVPVAKIKKGKYSLHVCARDDLKITSLCIIQGGEKVTPGWITNSVTAYVSNIGVIDCIKSPLDYNSLMSHAKKLEGQLTDALGTVWETGKKNAELEERIGKYINDYLEAQTSHVSTLAELSMLRNYHDSVMNKISLLEKEKEGLRGELKIHNDIVAERDGLLQDNHHLHKRIGERREECKQLISDLEKVRKESAQDLDVISKLSAENADLRRKVVELEREIISLREDAVYAVRSRSTPVKVVKREENTPYSEAISKIKEFNMGSLLSREQRDKSIANRKLAKEQLGSAIVH